MNSLTGIHVNSVWQLQSRSKVSVAARLRSFDHVLKKSCSVSALFYYLTGRVLFLFSGELINSVSLSDLCGTREEGFRKWLKHIWKQPLCVCVCVLCSWGVYSCSPDISTAVAPRLFLIWTEIYLITRGCRAVNNCLRWRQGQESAALRFVWLSTYLSNKCFVQKVSI